MELALEETLADSAYPRHFCPIFRQVEHSGLNIRKALSVLFSSLYWNAKVRATHFSPLHLVFRLRQVLHLQTHVSNQGHQYGKFAQLRFMKSREDIFLSQSVVEWKRKYIRCCDPSPLCMRLPVISHKPNLAGGLRIIDGSS